MPENIVLYAVMTFITVCLFVSLYYNYKFGVLILRVQDSIEKSLDILDEKYGSISQILEKPVFFDSVEIRQVLQDISSCRDTVLLVANDLAGSVEETNKEQQP